MEATALPTEPQPLPILKVTYRKGSNGKCTDGVDKNRLNLFKAFSIDLMAVIKYEIPRSVVNSIKNHYKWSEIGR